MKVVVIKGPLYEIVKKEAQKALRDCLIKEGGKL